MEEKINSLEFSKITEEIELLLQQFIRCSKDGIFDKNNPYEDLCESCSYERGKILELVEIYQKVSSDS
jgi:hypothetical protein